MKQLFFFLFLLLFLPVEAQHLVAQGDVTLLEGNIYARRNPRNDAAGNPCALIMVKSTEPNLTFEGNVCGEVKYENAIYYVYMSEGSTNLTVDNETRKKLSLKFPSLAAKASYEVTVGITSDKGSISLTTNPSGADVYMLSQGERIHLGRTPIKGNVKIKAGIYTFEVEKKGYEMWRKRKVDISKDKTVNLGNIKLKKQ
ncbi:MAG: PEGA domain-containing protein [Bacteroides sp.]|nr:PEGA domain-containing protein [Bacteroides sp.]